MAIILAAPNQTKKVFLWILYPTLIMVLVGIAVAVFLPQLKNIMSAKPVSSSETNIPTIVINMGFLDSDQLQSLEPFAVVTVEEIPAGKSNPFSK